MARNTRGRPIWIADAETDPFRKGRVPKPFIWGLYDIDNEAYYEFTDTNSFVEFIAEKDVIVYAHNGGKFDWHFITDYIDDFEALTIIAGRLAKFNIGMAEFRDSYNIIPAPLSAYQKDEISYDIFEEGVRDIPENWEKIRAYLKSDCIYLGELVSTFINEYGMSLTQAGAAMKTWSKMTGTKKPKTTDFYYSEFKKYYYGGRVECFHKGEYHGPFKVIDIKSAYPFAMTSRHPWGTVYNTYDCMPSHFTDDDLQRCFITMLAESHGAFPIRTKNGLQFPNDGELREFHITGWEYISARETGALRDVRIKTVIEYLESISFEEYVTYFFALKQEAEEQMKIAAAKGDGKALAYWTAQRLFAKLFLNSLYGKFASNPENYEEFMTLPADMLQAALDEDGWFFCKLISETTAVVNRPLQEEKRRYYDVAVAASVTGFVRAYLWGNICKTTTPLYCDTDSIAFAGDHRGIDMSGKLGSWDLEAECDYAAIAGKKLYAFRKLDGKYKTASKGVRLEPSEIIEIAKGGTVLYVPEAPTFSIKQGTVKFQSRSIKMQEN